LPCTATTCAWSITKRAPEAPHEHSNKCVLARIALSLSFGCVFLLIEIVSLILAFAW